MNPFFLKALQPKSIHEKHLFSLSMSPSLIHRALQPTRTNIKNLGALQPIFVRALQHNFSRLPPMGLQHFFRPVLWAARLLLLLPLLVIFLPGQLLLLLLLFLLPLLVLVHFLRVLLVVGDMQLAD